MTKLKQLLDKFASKQHTKENITNDFKEIAEQILFGGCFLVKNGKKIVKRIRIVDVEGYFHSEEEGENEIHDYVMYHRNYKAKDNPKPEFFDVGTFYPHVSGIDLTFESKKHFRAAMLLRSYQFVDENNKPITINDNSNKKVDIRPTHLYDDMLSGFTPFDSKCTVEWSEEKPFDKDSDKVSQTYRKNVSEYTEDSTSKKSKKKEIDIHDASQISTEDKKYVQDKRPWRFYISSLKQELKIKDLEKQ